LPLDFGVIQQHPAVAREAVARLVEYDCSIVVDEDLVPEVFVDGTRQHDLLEVPALADHVFDRVHVADGHHVLGDDRARVEI